MTRQADLTEAGTGETAREARESSLQLATVASATEELGTTVR
jgi:hypothetical protein